MSWLLLSVLPALAGTPSVDEQAVLDAVAQADAARARRAMPAPSIQDKDYRKAADGSIVTGLERVPGSGAKRAWGLAVVDAPIEVVWSAVNDFSNHTELTKVSFSEIQSGRNCESGRAVFQYLPIGVPMLSDRWWVTVITATPAVHQASGGRVRELTSVADMRPEALRTAQAKARSQQGTPIGFSKGGWLLTALDDGTTLAEFTVWSDPGGYVPASIATSFATGGVEDNLEALRLLVDKGPGCPIE